VGTDHDVDRAVRIEAGDRQGTDPGVGHAVTYVTRQQVVQHRHPVTDRQRSPTGSSVPTPDLAPADGG